MISCRLLTHSLKTVSTVTKARATPVFISTTLKPTRILRAITTTTKLYKQDRQSLPPSVDTSDSSHEGQFSRTDNKVSIEYPAEDQMPRSAPVQGRGSIHFKRTLASFSLEGRSGVVTGGARGLGLVMSQALVISGADVAIVDLNSEFQPKQLHFPTLTGLAEEEGQRQADLLMQHFHAENPGAEK